MDGITEWIVETFGAAIPAEWIIFAVSLLPLLEGLAEHPSPTVREHAAWASGAIRTREEDASCR